MEEEAREEGTYLYCVANHGLRENLGDIGIEENQVYVIPFRDIGAVVHSCLAEPYRSDDDEKGKRWILAHQYVVDIATERFGTVIPLTFDTIFKGGDDAVERWLRDEYSRLKDMLERFRERAEYGVRVYMEESCIEERASKNPEISMLRKTIEKKPMGAAYLLKKRLDQRVKARRDIEARAVAERLCGRIASLADEMIQEKGFVQEEGRFRVLKASCLVKNNNVEPLGKFLGEIDRKNGLTVTFTGPWPPYSFVFTKEKVRT